VSSQECVGRPVVQPEKLADLVTRNTLRAVALDRKGLEKLARNTVNIAELPGNVIWHLNCDFHNTNPPKSTPNRMIPLNRGDREGWQVKFNVFASEAKRQTFRPDRARTAGSGLVHGA
jgi:hypothetical protein